MARTLYTLAALLIGAALWSYHTPIDISVRARGVVRPEGEVIRVIAEAGGKITRVYVKEGADVRQGDALLQLDTRDLRLRQKSIESRIHFIELRLDALRRQIEDTTAIDEQAEAVETIEKDSLQRSTQASVDLAAGRFEKSELLLREGLIPRQLYDESRIALAQAQSEHARVSTESLVLKRSQSAARVRELSSQSTPLRADLTLLYDQLEQSRLDLARLTITSPAGGKIASLIPLHAGEMLSPNTMVATLLPSPHILILEALLPASDRAHVNVNQSVRLQSDSFPPDQYNIIGGAVTAISPDALNGAYRIRIAPDARDLHPGMTFQVHFITRHERLLWLPFIRIVRVMSYE